MPWKEELPMDQKTQFVSEQTHQPERGERISKGSISASRRAHPQS
ncbi:MAG: hypothetical protein WBV94_10565 [Blastocatellia bacterium]